MGMLEISYSLPVDGGTELECFKIIDSLLWSSYLPHLLTTSATGDSYSLDRIGGILISFILFLTVTLISVYIISRVVIVLSYFPY